VARDFPGFGWCGWRGRGRNGEKRFGCCDAVWRFGEEFLRSRVFDFGCGAWGVGGDGERAWREEAWRGRMVMRRWKGDGEWLRNCVGGRGLWSGRVGASLVDESQWRERDRGLL